MTKYRTEPDHTQTGWPKGVPYIIGNEGCERFSFYGMKSILFPYLAVLYCAEMVRERATELQCAALENPVLWDQLDQGAREALEQGPQKQAKAVVHFFIAGVYGLPMIGAIIADRLLGKYNTIMWLSIVYCMGHAALAIFEGELWGIYLGLGLIAVGSGGIKPCVSAHVGDQFGRANWGKVQKVFQAFYFIINFGSFFSTLLIPWVKEEYGWSVAFAIPGVLMGIATVWFWMGRNVFVHVSARPAGRLGLLDAVSSSFLFLTVGSLFITASYEWWVMLLASAACFAIGMILFSVRQSIEPDDGFLATMIYALRVKLTGREWVPAVADSQSAPPDAATDDDYQRRLRQNSFFGPAVRRFGMESAEGPVAVVKIITVFVMVSVFWALFDQHASSWIEQAAKMDLTVTLPIFGQMTLLKEQIAATNPILVMLLIPTTMFGLYPLIERLGLKMTPLRKMTLGMFIGSTAFVAVALIEQQIMAASETDQKVSVLWQFLPYVLMTLSEVMVSITGLEFAYTQAPRRMKSTIMGFWLLTVALGNAIAGILFASLSYSPEDFFWLFAGLMLGAAVVFGVIAAFYRYRDYTQ